MTFHPADFTLSELSVVSITFAVCAARKPTIHLKQFLGCASVIARSPIAPGRMRKTETCFEVEESVDSLSQAFLRSAALSTQMPQGISKVHVAKIAGSFGISRFTLSLSLVNRLESLCDFRYHILSDRRSAKAAGASVVSQGIPVLARRPMLRAQERRPPHL